VKILIVGGGGREHAMAWKVAQSSQVEHVFVAPGNGGTASEFKVSNVAIDVLAIQELADFVKKEAIKLTIVGPEVPLAAGIVDYFEQQGLACFGPSQKAAQLESSKAFSKAFMQRHGIPTAAYHVVETWPDAKKVIEHHPVPLVLKADGLAAGKGVIIAQTRQEALDAAHAMLESQCFGQAGKKLVIEEFLSGEEASFIVMIDGEHFVLLASSQDHKARDNGDLGPNTGGMGAYSPAPIVDEVTEHTVIETVVKPTIQGMQQDNMPYRGFLYMGLMVTQQGDIKVLEYNCRLGDPEAQPLLMRMRSDLVHLCQAAMQKSLDKVTIEWDPRVALGVVLCAEGYPENYRKGDVIGGVLTALPDGKVFHAGTCQRDGQLVTEGGRVLCVTVLAATVEDAQSLVYQWIKNIHWQGLYCRTDIGYRAIAREKMKV
jgi:phosphoribosylamine---glycine ligase